MQHPQSMYLSYDIFYEQAKVFPVEIVLGEILLEKVNRRGGGLVGIRMSWVENV